MVLGGPHDQLMANDFQARAVPAHFTEVSGPEGKLFVACGQLMHCLDVGASGGPITVDPGQLQAQQMLGAAVFCEI